MRLKLNLLPMQNHRTVAVPINYNYPIHSAIYKLLAESAPAYTSWLHDQGYPSSNRRRLKMFVFSKLDIPQVRRVNLTLQGASNIPWILYISSPMENDFIQNFVLSVFDKNYLEIGGIGAKCRFQISGIEAFPEPEFRFTMSGKTRSPIIATKSRGDNAPAYYFRISDSELPMALHQNLIQKYQIIHGKSLPESELRIEFDPEYIARKGERIYKLISIKEGKADMTQHKCFEAPFTISATPELLHTAWHCGLGEKNAMGFGMVDLW